MKDGRWKEKARSGNKDYMTTGPRTTVENAGHLTTDHGQQGTRNLVRRGIWQNDANRCSLSDHAFRFHPAAVELRDVLYDG